MHDLRVCVWGGEGGAGLSGVNKCKVVYNAHMTQHTTPQMQHAGEFVPSAVEI